MGRPSKLTPKVQADVCSALKAGATLRMAAQFAGIDVSTLHRWMASTRSPYREFREAVKAAEAHGDVGSLAVIQNAARNGTWQAAAWLLERRHPAEYGRRQVVAVQPAPVDVDALRDAARQGVSGVDAAVLWQRQLEVVERAYNNREISAEQYLAKLDRLTQQAARLQELQLKGGAGAGSDGLGSVQLVFDASSPSIARNAALPDDVPASRRLASGGDAIDVG